LNSLPAFPLGGDSLAFWKLEMATTILTGGEDVDGQIFPILERIWKKDIQKDYRDGLIVSESCLVAAFYHHARTHLEYPYEVFAQPTFWWNDGTRDMGKRCEPDLLIGRRENQENRYIAAVIEFKYTPFAGGKFDVKKDINKLAKIAASSESCGAMIDFETGTEFDVPTIGRNSLHARLDGTALLIYAIIGSAVADADL
jgi:hypothetical protein